MTLMVKGTRARSGGGGSRARHDTRRTELDRLVRELINSLFDQQGEGRRTREAELDDAPCFETRNLPEEALVEDSAADPLAAHIFGWDSDVALAEERLEREIERGRLVSQDGQPIDIRSSIERARAILEGPQKGYEELSATEREVIRFRAFWEMRDAEESFPSRRGRGSPVIGYEFVLSFPEPMANQEILGFVDQFRTREMTVIFNRKRGPEKITNPLRDLPAGITAHRQGTEHNHAHVLFDCRRADGTVAQIRPQVWRSFDVHAVSLWAEHLRSPEVLREYLEKKEQTLKWKRETRERKSSWLPPNPKPERVADTRDQRSLKLRSQITTDLKTAGLDPEKFRIVERLRGYRSNDAIRWLTAEAEIARQELIHSLATGKETAELRVFSARAEDLRRELIEARAAREGAKKRSRKSEAPFYYTDKQANYLEQLKGERREAARDNHLAGVLAGHRNYFQAQERFSRFDLKSFLDGREHLKFKREDRSNSRSLAEITASQDQAQSRLASRAGAGERNNNRQDELRLEKVEVERRLTEHEKELRRLLDRDEWRRELAEEALTQAVRDRSQPEPPAPIYRVEIYDFLDRAAHERGDGELAQHLWEVGREYRMTPERMNETMQLELGREYVARWRSLVAEEDYRRASAGTSGQDIRIRRDEQSGREEHGSSAAHKKQALDAARQYDEIRWAIVDECLERLGVSREQVVPTFERGEFERFKEGVRLMPQGELRVEFEGAIKRVEESLQQHEPLIETRHEEQGMSRPLEQPPVAKGVQDLLTHIALQSAKEPFSSEKKRERDELIQRQLQEARERQERMQPMKPKVIIPGESQTPVTRERNDQERTNRGGRGGR